MTRIAALALLLAAALAAPAQITHAAHEKALPGVHYLSEPIAITHGVAQSITLAFRVDDGFHINSHKPLDDTLIPTTLTLTPPADVKLGDIHYASGASFTLEGSTTPLNVYSGEFLIHVPIRAAQQGTLSLPATLRYQACDRRQCFPISTESFTVLVTVK